MITKGISCPVVIYSASETIPKVIETFFSGAEDFLRNAPEVILEELKKLNSEIPPVAVREVLQNLIHADFTMPVVSILHGGNTLRVSDQGKGIKDKEKCILHGFTTATEEMRKLIRGVGSGFSIVKEELKAKRGTLEIDDNLHGGTVVTLSLLPPSSDEIKSPSEDSKDIYLTERQKKVLLLFSEIGQGGPSCVSNELNIPIATAFRDIKYLEKNNLIKLSSGGKRFLTQKGIKYLQDIV